MSPSFKTIQDAYGVLQNDILRTPLLESSKLNQRFNARIFCKAECLQTTGSFKLRGATYFLKRLSPEERRCGVVAYSSGNHAQAVAFASSQLGISATIVMPQDAPKIKLEKTRSYGAQVYLYDREHESREAIAQNLCEERGAILLPPFDHPWIIAGQGTVGLEMTEEILALNETLDMVLIPCSGGGLSAGCSIAIHEQFPNAQIYAVEPEGYDDTRQSLEKGRRITITSTPSSLCDALLLKEPGELTFSVNQKHLSGGLVVSDHEVAEAMGLAYQALNIVVEAGGAVGLAALLSQKVHTEGKNIGIILSGGNVDPHLFQKIMAFLNPSSLK